MSNTLPLTGERTVPGVVSENYWFQRHVFAYRLAAERIHGVVLDAGCGEGYGAAILARRAETVLAVDVDAPAVHHAAGRYAAPRFVRADLAALPVRDRAVDGIVSLQVLEHLDQADRYIESCAHLLRPGGVLVLSTPNRDTFPAGLNPFHVHEYHAAELRAMLARHFPLVALGGVAHRSALRAAERLLGESIQERLIRQPYETLPRALRASLRLVTPGAFRFTKHAEQGLDLVAVCRAPARTR